MLYVLILDYEMTKRFRKVKYKREDYLLRLKGDEMQIESGRGCYTYTFFFCSCTDKAGLSGDVMSKGRKEGEGEKDEPFVSQAQNLTCNSVCPVSILLLFSYLALSASKG